MDSTESRYFVKFSVYSLKFRGGGLRFLDGILGGDGDVEGSSPFLLTTSLGNVRFVFRDPLFVTKEECFFKFLYDSFILLIVYDFFPVTTHDSPKPPFPYSLLTQCLLKIKMKVNKGEVEGWGLYDRSFRF